MDKGYGNVLDVITFCGNTPLKTIITKNFIASNEQTKASFYRLDK